MSDLPESVRTIPGYLRHMEDGNFDAADRLLWGTITGMLHASRLLGMQIGEMQDFAEGMQEDDIKRKQVAIECGWKGGDQ